MADLDGNSEIWPQPGTETWDVFLKRLGRPAEEALSLASDPDQSLTGTSGGEEQGGEEAVRKATAEDDEGDEGDDHVTDETSIKADSSVEPNTRKIITGLPRAQTFERRMAEQRVHLEPIAPTANERRAASIETRYPGVHASLQQPALRNPRSSNITIPSSSFDGRDSDCTPQLPADDDSYQLSSGRMETGAFESDGSSLDERDEKDPFSVLDTASVTASQHEAMITEELERKWILNLSMHFRDRSKREKFFVTYREKEHTWRRVTISLDYRNAPASSLEMDLLNKRSQREKSHKIYEAIRESLQDIQFYDTVTNLKLETSGGRLHVHVVEDGNEIINYPHLDQIRHLRCRRVRESEITFDSHMSGFVYKVKVQGRFLIKKEIPGPDTIEEFLYEVNALSSLRLSGSVVGLYGVVLDDVDQVKGLLIGFAERGALIDIIYDDCKEKSLGIPWETRQRWARQIVQGLADIHEAGFVQGDFTLSNIVVDAEGDAKIIDINRRGCPVGWEPPEATALIKTHQRMNLYIGVKSDLYQLGMVLWSLAMLEDEPETQGRPLMLGPEINIPDWYRQVTEICLSADPRMRMQASTLIHMFPLDAPGRAGPNAAAVDDTRSADERKGGNDADGGLPYVIRTVEPSDDWQYSSRTYVDPGPDPYRAWYSVRGRSPPSPLPSNADGVGFPDKLRSSTSWAANKSVRPSYSDDASRDDCAGEAAFRAETPPSLGKQDLETTVLDAADTTETQSKSHRCTSARSVSRKRSLGDGLHVMPTPKLSRWVTAIRDAFPDSQSSHREQHHVETTNISPGGNWSAQDLEIREADALEAKTSESETDGGASLQFLRDVANPGRPAQDGIKEQLGEQDERGGQTIQSGSTLAPAKMVRPAALAEAAPGARHQHLRQAESRKGSDCVRSQSHDGQTSLPLYLAGIGAGLHYDDDEKVEHERRSDDDDLDELTRPATVPAS